MNVLKPNLTVSPPNNYIKEYQEKVKRRTLTIEELAEVLGTSKEKARKLTHSKGFPIIILGVSRLTVVSKLDDWLEKNIGSDLI